MVGVTFHSLCIFCKLFPAARVGSEVQELGKAVNQRCEVSDGVIDKDIFFLQQHVKFSEDDVGYRIMGVKITMKLAGTLASSFVSFLLVVMRFSKSIRG